MLSWGNFSHERTAMPARKAKTLPALKALIRDRRVDLDISQQQMAEKLGIVQSHYSRLETGATNPSYVMRQKIAEALNIPFDEFEGQWKASKIGRTQGVPGKIPVLNIGPAGQIIDCDEWGVDSGQGYEYIDNESISSEDLSMLFALVVTGDSMQPTLLDGDYVVFRSMKTPLHQKDLQAGDVVSVRFSPESGHEGNWVCRFFTNDNESSRLVKDNKLHPERIVPYEHIQQIAKAVELRRKAF